MSGGAIDIDEFENADDNEFAERNDTEWIVRFLEEHDDRAWKVAAVAEQLELDTDAVSAILSRLKEHGPVQHKRPYWTITDNENGFVPPTDFTSTTRLQNEQYGEERFEELRTDEVAEVR